MFSMFVLILFKFSKVDLLHCLTNSVFVSFGFRCYVFELLWELAVFVISPMINAIYWWLLLCNSSQWSEDFLDRFIYLHTIFVGSKQTNTHKSLKWAQMYHINLFFDNYNNYELETFSIFWLRIWLVRMI